MNLRAYLASIFADTSNQAEERIELMFETYKDAKGEWRWRLKANNHRILCDSAEGFSKRSKALENIEKVRRMAPIAGIVELMVAPGSDG